MFVCASCGHAQALPEQLRGRKAKCPKCGQLGAVEQQPKPEPDISDVRLDDLAEAEPTKAKPAILTSSAALWPWRPLPARILWLIIFAISFPAAWL